MRIALSTLAHWFGLAAAFAGACSSGARPAATGRFDSQVSNDVEPPKDDRVRGDDGAIDVARPRDLLFDARDPQDFGVLLDGGVDSVADALPDSGGPRPWWPEPLPEPCVPADPWDPLEPVPFELVDAVAGSVYAVTDLDGNGLPELHAYIEEAEGAARGFELLFRIYEHDGRALHARADYRGGYPLGAGDVDGDGQPELASKGVPELDEAGQPTGVTTFGLTISSFRHPESFTGLEVRQRIYSHALPVSWPVEFYQALFADTDGDGRMEVVTSSPLLVFKWVVDVGLQLAYLDVDPQWPTSTHNPSAIAAVGDFDGRGPDEIVGFAHVPVQNSMLGGVRVLASRGDNRYEAVYRAVVPSTSLYLSGVGDVDGDGRPEFLRGGVSGLGGCWHYALYHWNQRGTYERVWSRSHYYPTDLPDVNSALGDTDGDGDAEIAVSLGDVVEIYENIGDWDMRRIQEIRLECPRQCDALVFFADLDRDGVDELLVVPRTHAADGGVLPEGTFVWRRMTP